MMQPSREKRSFNSLKQTKLELKCPNCKLMFKNLQQHLEASLICKQTVNKKITAEKVNEVVKPMKLQELNSPKMNKTKTMKQKCRGCLKEFSNLNYHISKSFLCQNNYVDEDEETRGQKGLSFKEDYPKKETVDVQIKKAEMEVSKDMKIQETMRLSSLDSETWLNDEIVNQYMKLLNTLDMNAFMFSTFFHTGFREGGFRRVKNYYKKHELLDYQTLYIPVHQNNHWFLITFDGQELITYDPFNYPQASEQERKRLLEKNVQSHLQTLKKLDSLYFKPMFKLKNKTYKIYF